MKKIIKRNWEFIKYRFKTASIRFVISVSFTITAIISMAFAGFLLYGRFSANTEEMIVKNSEQLINQVSLNLESYVRNMMRISDSMYYSVIKNVDLSSESLDKEMNLLYEANKDDLISIACFDEEGNLVGAAPVSSMKKDVDISTQDWYKKANDKIENLHFTTPQ